MKINEVLRKSTAVAIVAAILGVMPGAEFWRAAAAGEALIGTPVQTGGVASPVVGVNVPGANGLGLGGKTSSGGMLRGGIGQSRFGRQSSAVSGDAVLQSNGAKASEVQDAAALQPSSELRSPSPLRGEGNVVSRAQTLIKETPEFSKMASGDVSAAASSDFYKKVGQSFRGYGESAPAVRVTESGWKSLRASNGVSKDTKGSKKMPEHNDESVDGKGDTSRSVSDPDGSINPRRQDDGPDSVSDEPSRGSDWGGAALFSLAAAAVLIPAAAYAAPVIGLAVNPSVLVIGSIAWFGILMPSSILHEYAHGLMAYAMGDDTAKKAGRLTLNPLKHIDGKMTVGLPILLSLLGLPPFGVAKAMPVNEKNFKHERLGLALTAGVGPAVNLLLALGGVAVAHGLMGMATPVSPLVELAVYMVIRTNLLLAVYNLAPITALTMGGMSLMGLLHPASTLGFGIGMAIAMFMPGTDGFNMLKAAMPDSVRELMDALEKAMARSTLTRVIALAAMVLGPLQMFGQFSGLMADWMMGLGGFAAPAASAGALQAVATLPMVAALGLAFGPMSQPMSLTRIFSMPARPYTVAPPSAASSADRVKVMVRIPQPVRWKNDFHVDWVDWNQPDAFEKYQTSVLAMVAQLQKAGISADELQKFDAVPTATYATLVRAATLSVPADKKAALTEALKAKGLAVEDVKIHKLAVMDPEAANDPAKPASKRISMADAIRITGADKVQAELKKQMAAAIDPAKLNIPAMLKPATLWVMRKVGLLREFTDTKVAVIDTGSDKDHPMLKGKFDSVEKDGHGHGTWTTSANAAFDPLQKHIRAPATFKNGSASTDDILRDYTKEFKAGADLFSNSWGDSYGDPNSLEGQAVLEVAKAGKVQFFAAGNQGSDDNTVGGPAIVYFKDPKTGTMMLVSVGATDSDRVTAWFQSRGPYSPYVKENEAKFPGYPNRVDIQSIGHKVLGAYPTYMRGPDVKDPELGPQKESSGTSMSTPTMAGGYSLLRRFGFEPAAIIQALFDTAIKSGKAETEVRKESGDVDFYAAYQKLAKAQSQKTDAKIRALITGAFGLAALTVGLVALPQSAFAAVAAAASHPGLTVGMASIGGSLAGFTAGVALGMQRTKGMNDHGGDALIGIGIFLRLVVVGLYGLGGAVVGAIAGAVIAAHYLH